MSSMPPGEQPSEPSASEPTAESAASTPAVPEPEPPPEAAPAAAWPAADPPAPAWPAAAPAAAAAAAPPPADPSPAAQPPPPAADSQVPWAATAPAAAAAPSTVYWAATEEPGPAPGIEFAGHGGRLVAYIIDTILISILSTVILVLGFIAFGAGATVVGNRVTSVSTPGAILFLLSMTLTLAVIILYFPFFWARGGQTPGMRPFGLRVVRDRDGSSIGWGTALLRLVGLYVASAVLYIGLIWIFIDKRRRGWQDLIAGTVVIKRP
jgi:uncharacterized RDD family membrane protein YckC